MRKFKECTGLETVSWPTAVYIGINDYMIGKVSLPAAILLWALAIAGFGSPKGIIKVLLVTCHWIVLHYIRGGPVIGPLDIVLILTVAEWIFRKLFQ